MARLQGYDCPNSIKMQIADDINGGKEVSESRLVTRLVAQHYAVPQWVRDWIRQEAIRNERSEAQELSALLQELAKSKGVKPKHTVDTLSFDDTQEILMHAAQDPGTAQKLIELLVNFGKRSASSACDVASAVKLLCSF